MWILLANLQLTSLPRMVRSSFTLSGKRCALQTVYQCDTVLAVKSFLEDVCPTVGHTSKYKPKTGPTSGIGARQISAFLGKENWSKSTVASLLQIHKDLNPEIMRELL